MPYASRWSTASASPTVGSWILQLNAVARPSTARGWSATTPRPISAPPTQRESRARGSRSVGCGLASTIGRTSRWRRSRRRSTRSCEARRALATTGERLRGGRGGAGHLGAAEGTLDEEDERLLHVQAVA